MGLQKLSCAELRVEGLEDAVAFNTEVFGLSEVAREGGRVFLTCGADSSSVQLVLNEGGSGLTAFALTVDSEEDLDVFAGRLEGIGVKCERRTDSAPGRSDALVFNLPSGQAVELTPDPARAVYPHPAFDDTAVRSGVGVVDIDHVTIAFDDPRKGREAVDLLAQGLGFSVSDVILDPEEEWLGAWTRVGELHHDVGLIRCQQGASLHHLAWTLQGADHMKVAADALAGSGHALETGPGRHGVGGNLYTYFWAPGGNRYELSAEMPRVVGDRSDPLVRNAKEFNSFSAWGIPRPESFKRGS